MGSRTLNAKRNIIWGVIQKVLFMLFGFFIKSVIIYNLGVLYLGLNSLFSAILQVLSLTELGIGEAMVFSMYKPLAENDDKTICALLRLYRTIYFIIGVFILVAGLCISPFLPKLISGEVPPDINVYILFFVYLINTSISYLMYAYKESLLIANQRSDINNNISTVITMAMYVGQIVSIICFKSYYAYCILIPVFTLIRNIAVKYTTDKLYPEIKCFGEISKAMKSDIWQRVSGLFIYKVCGIFRNSFDSIILSAFLGLAVLAKYQNYYYILSSLSALMIIITSSITASVGNSIVKESCKKNYSDFNKFQLLFMGITGWITVCLFNLYQPFIQLWVGDDMLFDNAMMILFCVYFFTTQMGNMCYVYRQAAGLWHRDKYRPVVESIVNITLNILLVKLLGASGVLLSTVFCLVFINCVWGSYILFKYYFSDYKVGAYYLRLVGYAAITFLGCYISNEIIPLIPVQGIVGFLIKGIICSVFSLVFFALIFMIFPEYKDALQFIIRIIHKSL